MNRKVLKDMLKLKMEMLDGITEHLPFAAKERIDSLQHEFLTVLCEAANEYLQKKKPDAGKEHVKPVSIE